MSAADAAHKRPSDLSKRGSAHGMTSRGQAPSNSDTESASFGRAGGRRHRDDEFLKISEVAKRVHVSDRTVRRWIDAGDLVVHRLGSVVRIAEGDLWAFLALHREAYGCQSLS
jgi:excisionase family DNA binding protein